MLGRRCELWHGDVGQSHRNRIKSDPPDILLTTPESLEVMLISTKSEGREMLRSVRVVVIDEIHAFAGDDRGWHLLAVLERITRIANREIQRIGLSATVGNPEELLGWLAGHCRGTRRVIQPEKASSQADADVQLDYVGSLSNAAIVISRLFRGEKRLVFCDSRSRVEELGNELRRLGVSAFLSHSSLSAEQRRTAEHAFSEARDCVIVATSTLELGIDVGDLDRVIQIDAPWSVASFLQRLGRTGRRQGSTRNCLFLATSEDALLRAAALLALWEAGYVEPVTPPAHPFHLFAQQLMALALQEGGVGTKDWPRWIGRLPCFGEDNRERLESIISYLFENRFLYHDEGILSVGEAGEDQYGRRHFMELVSVFTSEPMFRVMHGAQELGSVDQITFARHRETEPAILSMGGRSWIVTSLDWQRREAFVVPADSKGRSQWLGGRGGMSWEFTRAIHRLLTSHDEDRRWTGRTRQAFGTLRSEYAFLRRECNVAVVHRDQNEIRWFTFAGAAVNTALADAISAKTGDQVSATDFMIRIHGCTDTAGTIGYARGIPSAVLQEAFRITDDFLDKLKFSECLPREIALRIVRERTVSCKAVELTLEQQVTVMVES